MRGKCLFQILILRWSFKWNTPFSLVQQHFLSMLWIQSLSTVSVSVFVCSCGTAWGLCSVHSFYHKGLHGSSRIALSVLDWLHSPSSPHENSALGQCLVCSQVLCLLPSIHMSSCQFMDKMSSMPTVAKIWVIWIPTSLLWQKKPTSRWPGERHLSSAVPWERLTKGGAYSAWLQLLKRWWE